jgi:hypothetical protein
MIKIGFSSFCFLPLTLVRHGTAVDSNGTKKVYKIVNNKPEHHNSRCVDQIEAFRSF